MRICPNCAAENADTALFCISCGSSLKNARTKPLPVKKIAGLDEEARFRTEELFSAPEKSFREMDEEEEFERQIRRYMREQGPAAKGNGDRKGAREDKKTVLIGVICVLGVLVAGIFAFHASSGAFATDTRQTTARLSDDMIRELTREKEAEKDLDTDLAAADMADVTAEAEEADAAQTGVSASIMQAGDLDNEGYARVVITDAQATSVIDQEGFDNSPIRAADENESTSWQEGVSGPGIGETVEYIFDREYSIHSMTFKLGNWASENYFWKNNRPKTMTIWLDDVGFEVTFPDGMTEYALTFSRDIPASSAQFVINSVYEGSTYDDTCITDIGIYGT